MPAVYQNTLTLRAIVALANQNLYAGATDYSGTLVYDIATETLSVTEGGLGLTQPSARQNADTVVQFDYPDFDTNPAEVFFALVSNEPNPDNNSNFYARVDVFRNGLAPFQDIFQVKLYGEDATSVNITPPPAGTRVTVAFRPLNSGVDLVWDGYSSSIGVGSGGPLYQPQGPQTLVTAMLAGSIEAVCFYENIRPLGGFES